MYYSSLAQVVLPSQEMGSAGLDTKLFGNAAVDTNEKKDKVIDRPRFTRW